MKRRSNPLICMKERNTLIIGAIHGKKTLIDLTGKVKYMNDWGRQLLLLWREKECGWLVEVFIFNICGLVIKGGVNWKGTNLDHRILLDQDESNRKFRKGQRVVKCYPKWLKEEGGVITIIRINKDIIVTYLESDFVIRRFMGFIRGIDFKRQQSKTWLED